MMLKDELELDESMDYRFEDIFDLEEIQKIQDAFALATGVASIIIDRNGVPITKPSNYCDLCTKVIGGTRMGAERCAHSHSVVEKSSKEGPSFKYCLSAGMMDGGACIYVGERHVADWLIGQVLEDTITDEQMMAYCREIGADEALFREALGKVRRISKQDYQNICNAVFLFARQLSILGIQNIKLKKEIKESMVREAKIQYLSIRDPLTGLFNRRYFEEKLNELNSSNNFPVSIIMGDANGLKMANDVFGHEQGDQLLKTISNIFKTNSQPDHIISRIGGDEFAMILPSTVYTEAAVYLEAIKAGCRVPVDAPIQPSVALGLAEKNSKSQSLFEVFKEAEDRMYNNKLIESKSTRSSIIASLRKTLDEKTHETEAHGSRLKKFMVEIARLIGVKEVQIFEFELLAVLHDIGKVAIPDHILEKPGPLDRDEWRVMMNHSEIGYRIAASTPELITIAEPILCHHERWDGGGYPQGISKENIPLSSRVLAVVDAFDAMTNDRAYRKAISQEQALVEIMRCAGSQFDPRITEAFITVVSSKNLNCH